MTIPMTDTALDLEKTAIARCARRSPFRSWPAWVYFGVFLMSFGVFYIFWCTDSIRDYVYSQLQLRNGTESFKMWTHPPVNLHFEIYAFNYTNVEDFQAYRTDKLHVEEVGPYIYVETKKRVNVVNNNDTLSYQEEKTYEWVGGRPEDDLIVVPNVPLLAASAFAKDLNFAAQLSISALLTSFKEKPFIHVKVGNFLWGYDDAFFDMIKPLLRLKQDVPFEKFGILAMKRGIDKDRVTINTGTQDINKLGLLERVNGLTSRNVWDDERCDKIKGTDGGLFPPYLVGNTNNTLHIYYKDLCRSIPFVFSEKTTVYNLPVWRYKPSRDSFTFTIEKNKCFCQKKGHSRVCPPQGVQDISVCVNDSPVIISLPHFLHADKSLLKQVDGLHPRPEDHESYIDVFPDVSATISGWTKLQTNIHVRKALGVPLLGRLRDNMILPLFWFKIGARELPQFMLDTFYFVNVTLHVIETILQWSSLVGMILSMGALLVCFKKYRMEHPDVGLQMSSVGQHKLELA